MEKAEANQNTASTSALSWSHVVRGQIQSQSQSQAGENSNSNCQGQGIAHNNNDMRRSQSPSPSTSSSPSEGEILFGSELEIWPPLGQAPTPTRTSTPSSSASSTFPIPSSELQDKRPSDLVGNKVSNNVTVSQAPEKNPHAPRGKNIHNRPLFSQKNGYKPQVMNSHNRAFFSQGTETNGYVPPGRNTPNRPIFSHNTNIAHSTGQHFTGHGYPPKAGYGNMHNRYDQREPPPRGGYANMHNNIHDQREYNYNWNSEQAFHGINNVTMYEQFGPTNNMRQRPLPQLPIVDGVANQFYMNAAPMPAYYFPHPMYFDASNGGPYFMPTLPPVPVISQINVDLRKKIVNQVDFYFSVDNLCKDRYLREHMDEDCWVAISVVAGFKKMRQLTHDVNVILAALEDSKVVELQDDKIRRRNDWYKWPNPNYIIGFQKQAGHTDASSSSETASELGTSERVFPERDTPEQVLDTKIDLT